MSRRRRSNPFSLFAFQDIITATTGIVILLTLLLTLELLTRKTASAPLVSAQLVREAENALQALAEQAAELRQRVATEQSGIAELVTAETQDVDRKIRDLQNQIALSQRELESLNETATQRRAAEEEALAQQFDRREDRERAARLAEKIRQVQAELESIRSSNALYFNPSDETGQTAWLVEVSSSRLVVARAGQHQQALHTFAGRGAAEQFIEFARTRDSTREYFVLLVRPSGVGVFDELQDELESSGYRFGLDLISESQVVIGAARPGGAP